MGFIESVIIERAPSIILSIILSLAVKYIVPILLIVGVVLLISYQRKSEARAYRKMYLDMMNEQAAKREAESRSQQPETTASEPPVQTEQPKLTETTASEPPAQE